MFGRKTIAALEARLARVEAALAWERSGRQATGVAVPDNTGRLDSIEHRLDAVNSGHDAHLRDLSDGLRDVQQALEGVRVGHDAHLRDLGRATSAVEEAIEGVRAGHHAHLRSLGRLLSSTIHVVSAISNAEIIASPELQAIGPTPKLINRDTLQDRALLVWTVVRWLAQAPIEMDTLVSVIMPTRNRRPYLARAIESVLTQRHAALELIVVDDGSTDGTGELLAAISDPRVRALRTGGIGAPAARNLGLDAASGAIIAHLDDDNLMDPLWLRGVAWAFNRWPDTELLYGARIVEDAAAQNRTPSGAMPALEWLPFDRARLELGNYIDTNVIAHRAGLKHARFDPALTSSIEWDVLLRLTADRAPLELPVIACLYSNYAPNRVTDSPTRQVSNNLVRARVHTTRPMRVLCCNAASSPVAATVIEEEMLALETQGARIAFAGADAPFEMRLPIHAALDEGIAVHRPDVIVAYSASRVPGEIERLTRARRPFALRVGAAHGQMDAEQLIRDHTFCVGVWAMPKPRDTGRDRYLHEELSAALTAWRMSRQVA